MVITMAGRSSSRAKATRRLISWVSRVICWWLLCVHSLSPLSSSTISLLALMMAKGVLSSWLALVINSFCRRSALMIGSIARLEKRANRRVYRAKEASPRIIADWKIWLTRAIRMVSSKKTIVVSLPCFPRR